MIGVCFFVDARHSCGKDIRTEEWLSLCRSFEFDRQLVIDRTNLACFSPAVDHDHPAEVFKGFNEVTAAYPDARYIMVERQAPDPIVPTLIDDFEHPAGDVIYCFGPDGGGLEGLKPPNADWIVVPMSDQTRWGMWAILAATLVMADRWRRVNN